MSTIATKTITLIDLAEAVNRIIIERPEDCNPFSDYTNSCLYFDGYGGRCLIGQALYDLTGMNVPKDFEGRGIYALLLHDTDFCEHFDIDFGSARGDMTLFEQIVQAQNEADGQIAWGQVRPIHIPA
jgi:hypothetical protein